MLALMVVVLLPIAALAGPGEGIRIGKLTLSPFVNAVPTYDSNVFLTEDNPLDDLFFDAMFGASAAEKVRSVSLDLRAWYLIRRYQQYTEKDHDEYGESASLGIGSSERTLVQFTQRFRRTEDYERTPGSVEFVSPENQSLVLSEDRTMRVPRYLNDVGISVSRKMGVKTTILGSGAFNNNDYDAETLYDWSETTFLAQFSHLLTDKTSATLTGNYGTQRSDGFEGDVRFYSVDVGLKMRKSAKLHLDAAIGLENYESPTNTGPANPTFVNFNAAARWAATKKWTFQLSARNGMQPASQFKNDTMKVTLFSLSLERPIKTSWLFSMTGAYRYDLYSNTKGAGDLAPEDTAVVQDDSSADEAWSRQWAGHIRMDYRPERKFYNFYAEVRYEDTESIWFRYEQLRASLGLSLRY